MSRRGKVHPVVSSSPLIFLPDSLATQTRQHHGGASKDSLPVRTQFPKTQQAGSRRTLSPKLRIVLRIMNMRLSVSPQFPVRGGFGGISSLLSILLLRSSITASEPFLRRRSRSSTWGTETSNTDGTH